MVINLRSSLVWSQVNISFGYNVSCFLVVFCLYLSDDGHLTVG
uniref:Uncharacterized protein n=1 Tax=Anguilla anguilla TaxID=7936 RepID=A0A0E9W7L1_ANGAN